MTPPLVRRVDGALSRGIEALWADQRQDGSLAGENHAGPLFTGLVLLVEAWLGTLTAADARESTRWILAQQDPAGFFAATPTRLPPSVDATWCAVAGLRAAGRPEARPAIDRALAWLDGRQPSLFYQPLLALHDPSLAPDMPLAWVALPPARRLVWGRFHPWVVFAMLTAAAIGHGLRHAPAPRHTLRGRVQDAAIRAIQTVQNPCGSWVGATLFTLQAVVALRLLGVSHDHTSITQARAWIRHWKIRSDAGLEVMPFTADAWNTARTLRAALLAGQPATDPRVARAARWLAGAQCRHPPPPGWLATPPGAPEVGGWAYESSDLHSPDCDTAAAAVGALALYVRHTGDPTASAAVDRGTAWLLGMQNPDGGFPGFRHGLGTKAPGPLYRQPVEFPTDLAGRVRLFLRPPPELQDPATAGVTGRALVALAEAGAPREALRRAQAFVLTQQWQDRWFGRWDCNYQAGTGYALAGLAAAGQAPGCEPVRRAVAWLEGRQNPDGGWGEGITTYRDPEAGPDASRADLTGTVLSGLIACGRADTAVVRAGIAHLLDTQRADGTWGGPVPLYVLDPPDEFYSNPVAALAAPVEALAAFRRHVGARET